MSSIYTITADELKKSWFNLGWDYFAAYQGLPIESEDYPDFMCGYNAAKSKVTPKSQDRFHKKWLQMRYGALKRNRYFNDKVTPEYIKKIDVEYCPVTFLKLTHSTGQDTDWSVDRVSNDIGYVLGNLVIVSSKANTAKWSMSYEEITNIALKNETVNGLSPIEWKRWRSISGLSAPKVNDEGESEFGFYHTPQLIVPPKGLYINPHAAMQSVLCSFAITGNRSLYDVLTAGLSKANRQNINDLVRLIKKHTYAVCYHPLDVWAVDKLYDKYEEYYQQILRTDSTVFYNNYDHLFSKSKKASVDSASICEQGWDVRAKGYVHATA